MDKKVAGLVKKVMGDGEKVAPVKKIKLKVDFQKARGTSDGHMPRSKKKK